MKKFLLILVLLGFLVDFGASLYAVTALDDEEYVQQGSGCGDDEPASWDDDNDLSE